MTSITVTALRNDIYQTINRVNEECKPIAITTSKGKGAVLIGEDEWAAIEETLYLNSIPGLVDTIISGGKEPLEDCVRAEELEW